LEIPGPGDADPAQGVLAGGAEPGDNGIDPAGSDSPGSGIGSQGNRTTGRSRHQKSRKVIFPALVGSLARHSAKPSSRTAPR